MHGFLVGIELKGIIDVDDTMQRIVDGIMTQEDVEKVDIEYLGPLDIVSEVEQEALEIVQRGKVKES